MTLAPLKRTKKVHDWQKLGHAVCPPSTAPAPAFTSGHKRQRLRLFRGMTIVTSGSPFHLFLSYTRVSARHLLNGRVTKKVELSGTRAGQELSRPNAKGLPSIGPHTPTSAIAFGRNADRAVPARTTLGHGTHYAESRIRENQHETSPRVPAPGQA